MLKAVIEQVQARAKIFFGEAAGGVAVFSDHHRNFETPRDQERLVAVFRGGAVGMNQRHALCLAAVATRQDVEADTTTLEHLAQRDDERRFARAAGGDGADADHRAAQAPRRKNAAVIELVTRARYGRVDRREWVHASFSTRRLGTRVARNPSNASTVA